MLQACEQQGKNEHKIVFEEIWLNEADAGFRICAKTYKIISDNTAKKCPYCGANYQSEFDGEICTVCSVSQIGVEALGLKITNN